VLSRYALGAVQFEGLSLASEAPPVLGRYALEAAQSSLPQARADGYRSGF